MNSAWPYMCMPFQGCSQMQKVRLEIWVKSQHKFLTHYSAEKVLCTSISFIVFKKQILQEATTDIFNSLVPKACNIQCQNLLFSLQNKLLKINWWIFISCALSNNGLNPKKLPCTTAHDMITWCATVDDYKHYNIIYLCVFLAWKAN